WSERCVIPRTCWTTRFDDLLTSDVDVIVETIGGEEPATEWIRAALIVGKSVVTANKQVIACHAPSLLALAARQGRQLRFEATVGRQSLFARTMGPRNAAVISGTFSGEIEISGAGAGGDATAVAILSDILAISRDRAAIVPAPVLSVPDAILGVRSSPFGILN